MYDTRKVVIVGAGHVGSHVALALIQSGEADRRPHRRLFYGTFLSPMYRCRYRTDLLCHRRMLARNVWSQRISARI